MKSIPQMQCFISAFHRVCMPFKCKVRDWIQWHEIKLNSLAPNASFIRFHSLGNSAYIVSSIWNSSLWHVVVLSVHETTPSGIRMWGFVDIIQNCLKLGRNSSQCIVSSLVVFLIKGWSTTTSYKKKKTIVHNAPKRAQPHKQRTQQNTTPTLTGRGAKRSH
jgi:hypothetical protein